MASLENLEDYENNLENVETEVENTEEKCSGSGMIQSIFAFFVPKWERK